MDMDLNAKAAYIRGLMTGMEFDANSKDGKIIAAMMDLLEEMASTVTEHDQALDQVYEDVDTLDEDLTDLINIVFDNDDEEDSDSDDEEDGDNATYEVTCPNCGAVSTVEEDDLLNNELVCPNCGAAFDIELSEEDEPEEDAPAQPAEPSNTEITID